jgi:hypothetical protein
MSLTVAQHFGGAKVYRIALIGCTGAGKTCLLAALGAVSGPHVTARRLRALPDAASAASGDGVTAFNQGNETLGRAEQDMRAGRQPAATDPSRPPLLAVYELSVPGRGQLTVEVADYSGELLNSRATNETGRRALAEICRDCDAVVVLADAPQKDRHGASHTHMAAVRACFSEWVTGARGGVKVPIPVALVFTMFDRRVRHGATADERAAALAHLLESDEYGDLVRELRNVCDVFQEFAASAFGGRVPPTAGSAGDSPLSFPTNTFGLQPPFVWACAEADKRKAAELREQCDSYRWLVPGWRGGFKLATRARALAPRMHDGTEEQRTTRAVARRAWRKGTSRLGALVATVLLLAAVVDASFGSSPRRDRDAVRSLSTPDPEYDTAVRSLADYAGSPWFRHRLNKWVFLDSREAHEHVTRAETAREQWQWDAAQSTTDRGDKYDRLLKFKTRYPNGSRASEADRLIKEEETLRVNEERATAQARREREHNELLARLEDQYTATVKQINNDLELASTQNSEPGLVAVQKRLRALRPESPLPDTHERIESRGTLDKQITDKLGALTKDDKERARLKAEQELRTKWLRDYRDVVDRWNALDLKGAAELVEEKKTAYAGLPDYHVYRDQFAAGVLAHVGAKVEQAKNKQDIAELKATIDKIEAALGCAQLKLLVTDQSSLNKLSERRGELVTTHDRALYSKFTDEPTAEKAEAYLRATLRDTMKDAVRAYVNALKQFSAPHTVKVKLTIGWGNWPGGTHNQMALYHQKGRSPEWIQSHVWPKIAGKPNDDTEVESPEIPDVVPDQPFKFSFDVQRISGTFISDTYVVEAMATDDAPLASDFRNGKTFALKPNPGSKDPKAHVTVAMTGLPPVPTVPAWREK